MTAMLLPVTLVTAGGCALINLWLAFRVGSVRRSESVSIGDGGSDRLIRRMRAQANFVEYAPFVLILLALVEFSTGTSSWLWAAGLVFLVGRVMHGFGMDGWSAGRTVGTGITFLLLVGLGLYAIALPLIVHHDDTRAIPIEAVPAG